MPLKFTRTLQVVSPIDYSIPQVDKIVLSNEHVPIVCLTPAYFAGLSAIFFLLSILFVVSFYLYLRSRNSKF